jgi:hypothetical protein
MDWVSIQKPDAERAKRIVCAIIDAAGGRFEGKTRLNKAFWWAHVYHYRNHRGLLSKYPIARLTEGPAIDDADLLLISLERKGRITQGQQQKGGYPESVFALTQKPEALEDEAMDSIRAAVRWVGNKTAYQVSDESHRLSRSWNERKNGDLIEVGNDALNDDDLKQSQAQVDKIQKNLDWASEAVGKVFGQSVGQARQVVR